MNLNKKICNITIENYLIAAGIVFAAVMAIFLCFIAALYIPVWITFTICIGGILCALLFAVASSLQLMNKS